MTNIRLKGNKEIDILALNPNTNERFHVEARIATTKGFRLGVKETFTKDGTGHRDGVGFFKREKFDHPAVIEKIKDVFGTSEYKKILVVWGVKSNDVFKEAEKQGFEVKLMQHIVKEIIERIGKRRGSRDDIMRTIELVLGSTGR